MKLNKNGWGTIEMLLLSCGILITLVVTIFLIKELYGSFSSMVGNRQYLDLESRIESAAKSYVETKEIEINGEYKITLETLKSNGFIDELKDLEGNTCNGYVRAQFKNDDTYYKGYILCKNYQTNNY